MESEGFKRKLSAILSADVLGYSRLMGENEERTIRSINTYRKLIASLTDKHHVIGTSLVGLTSAINWIMAILSLIDGPIEITYYIIIENQ